MTTSAEQVSRLLNLVPYLQQHPDADLRHTAEVFGVSSGQLLTDLKVLWFCGLPGGAPGDLIDVDMDALESDGSIRLTNADYLGRPRRFTHDEATGLMVALRTLLEAGDSSVRAAVESALAKIEAVVGESAPRVGVRLETGENAVRDGLALAIADRTAVRLEYNGATRGVATRPIVEPARIALRDGWSYLDAWSRDRDGWRTYRLDRIVSVEPAGDPATDHGEPPAQQGGWLDHRPDAVEVILELSPAGRWITEYHPMIEVSPLPSPGPGAGGVRARLLVADPVWLRRLLLRLGPAVLAVQPPEAAESAADAAREALVLYGDGPGAG